VVMLGTTVIAGGLVVSGLVGVVSSSCSSVSREDTVADGDVGDDWLDCCEVKAWSDVFMVYMCVFS